MWLFSKGDADETTYGAHVRAVVVDLSGGSVTVRGGAPGVISVRRYPRYLLVRAPLHVRVTGETLRVSGGLRRLPWRASTDVELRVPPGTAVNAQVARGNAVATDLRGRVELRAVRGSVTVFRVAGSLRAESRDGTVTVRDSGPEVVVRSGAGDVYVGCSVAPVLVDAASDRGDVDVVLPVVPASAVARPPVRTSGGAGGLAGLGGPDGPGGPVGYDVRAAGPGSRVEVPVDPAGPCISAVSGTGTARVASVWAPRLQRGSARAG